MPKGDGMKRLFDFACAYLLLCFLGPVLFFIALAVMLESGPPIFFVQTRVGRRGKHFGLFKFRTMYKDAESRGQLTLGDRDPRVTKVGYYLRKYKVDELPQLFNVLLGHMSLVGPRPEVPKYVKLYNKEQLQVLKLRPGITDWASIEYMDEAELLAKAEDPEKMYIEEIMPRKLQINLDYMAQRKGLISDIAALFKTVFKIFR